MKRGPVLAFHKEKRTPIKYFFWRFTLKEIIWMIIAILIFGFTIGISYNTEKGTLSFNFTLSILLTSLIIIPVSILAKKITANWYSMKVEHSLWKWQRWGYYERSYFNKPVPMGILFPILVSVLTLGYVKPFVFLEFDSENIFEKRILKKQGSRRATRKSEINESDPAFTAAGGFYSLILLAIVGAILFHYFKITFGATLAKYAIFYGAWNLVPWGKLDGAKLFFGSLLSWAFIVIIYLISLVIVWVV